MHEREELVVDLHALADRPADQQVGQHRRAGLADRAAERVVGDVRHGRARVGVLERDPQRHLVTADRVHVPDLGVERFPQARVVRVPVVVQDDLLVQRFQSHQRPPAPKNRCASRMPSEPATKRSGFYAYTHGLTRLGPEPLIENRMRMQQVVGAYRAGNKYADTFGTIRGRTWNPKSNTSSPGTADAMYVNSSRRAT